MKIKMIAENTSAHAALIAHVELMIGQQLPADFREFLLRSDGAEPELNWLHIPPDNSSSIREVYSIEQMVEEKTALADRLSPDSWPIACDGCGNLIVLRRENGQWRIAFWDHESENEVIISNSFTEFLSMLVPFNASSVLRHAEKEH